MDKLLYCKYCGTEHLEINNMLCRKCHKDNALVYSLKNKEYYQDKAEELYNNFLRYEKVLFDEEICKNPDFDPNLKRSVEYDRMMNVMSRNDSNNTRKPKCPTCGSTNIKKISTTSKVAGAAMFGLFSKTARSQFCCNSCGYKW